MSLNFETVISYLSRMSSISWGDVIEILIIAFLIYHILTWIKNSRAWSLLKALSFIVIFSMLAYAFQMTTILWIVKNLFSVALMAIIIILQPEIRKAMEELGKNKILSLFSLFSGSDRKKLALEEFSEKTINEITRACVDMGKVKTGALIVIQDVDPLLEYERTGIDIDGLVTSQLLINIFEHNTPLHDGAVIIRGNRITSATCYLPLSDNMRLSKDLGTRHRAGVGISEATDSVTIIVSEETGKISLAYKGELLRNLDSESLKEKLRFLLHLNEDDETSKKHFLWKGRVKNEK